MIAIHWFRRDLRLEDNTALNQALRQGIHVLPIFIFDSNIIDELPNDDPRINFIYDSLQKIDQQLKQLNSSLKIFIGDPLDIWHRLTEAYQIDTVYCNSDYEPYAIHRDEKVAHYLSEKGIQFVQTKDQVIFEKEEITKNDRTPYTVFTPYKKKWLQHFALKTPEIPKAAASNYLPYSIDFPSRDQLGLIQSNITVKPYDLSQLANYSSLRDFPNPDGTSYLGPHLRFGTIGVRQIVRQLQKEDEVFLSELIWREFFMQILHHYPYVISHCFRSKYESIKWRNNEAEFDAWCMGKTGYPLVDAGMRQLNQTGYMHNRVRMVTASFLCKHLLIDWRWGEAYFAKKLLDYELSSNNGNWQWVAGTGCDAAPYFRVFNPTEQQKRFDNQLEYVKKWLPEYDTNDYCQPMVDHKMARERALSTYKAGILTN